MPVKGLDVLVEAVAGLQGDKPLCVLVGEGPDQADLSKLAEKRGIADRLCFVGRKPLRNSVL